MLEIMQSATGMTLILGPFVSQADGKTPIEGVDLTTADSAIIFRHGATTASCSIDSATWTSMGSGYYSLAATSTFFDTLGQARIAINDVSLILPYFMDLMVVHDNYWNAKYSTSPFMASASGGTIASVSNSVNFTTGTIASVSNSVWWTAIRDVGTVTGGVVGVVASVSALGAQTIASVSNSVNFTTGTIASVSNSVWWTAIRDVGTVTGSVASVSALGVQTIASVSGSVYDNTVGVASNVWSAASADFAVAGTFGGILGGLGAGADPWSSTVTAYTGTNTFGLLLGGLPSTTTLASAVMAAVGKTAYIPSATVETWTIASVSNSVHIGVTDVGSVTGNLLGTVASVSSSVLIQAGQTIASVSNSVWWTAIRDVGTVTGSVASVSAIGVQTIASVSGSMYGMGITIMGKTDYLPSMTVASWTIGLVGSVSASVVDGIFEEVVEGTTTFRQSQMYQNAFSAGKAAVAAGSATASFRDIADTKNRLVFDVDEDGNRTTVTRDGT